MHTKNGGFMRKFFLIVLFISLSFCSNNNSESSTPSVSDNNSDNINHEVTWHTLDEGLKLAQKEEKGAIVDFYADWCVWCKRMEEQVFKKPDVARILNESFVMIRVDTESTESITYNNTKMTPQELSSIFQVTGLPTLLFFDKKGNPVTKIPGFIEADTFKSLLGYMDDECYNKKISFDKYLKGEVKCE